MEQDVHRAWVAGCQSRLDGSSEAELEGILRDAAAARERARAAGDPREVVPVYEQLLQEIEERLAVLRLDRTLATMDLAGFTALLAHTDVAVRIQAIQSAGERQLEGAAEALARHLREEPDRFVLATGVKSLGLIGSPADAHLLEAYLRAEDPRVRANAVEGLCHLGAGPELLLRCAEDVDHRVRANVAFGLLDFRPEVARRIMRSLLRDPSESARNSGLGILERLDPERFLETYMDALDSPAPDVAASVLETLSGSRDPRVVLLVMELLEDEERPLALRSQAMQAARSLAERTEDEGRREMLEEAAHAFLKRLTEEDAPDPEEREERASEQEAAPGPAGSEPAGAEPAGSSGSGRRRPRTGAEQMRERVKKWVKVIGRVQDSVTKRPVLRATVRVASSGMQELTDRKGQFSMSRLERGETYVFVIEKEGYPTRSVRYRCSGKKEQIVRIVLIGKRG